MVSCDIPASRKRRSTDKSVEGYDLSLSYDGTNYGDSVSFIIILLLPLFQRNIEIG
jgi:hypothetical protein